MFRRIKELLAPPIFSGDEEKTRMVAMLNTAMIATVVILTVTLPLYGFYTYYHAVFISPFIVVSLIVLLLIRRGHLYLTTRIAIVVYWILLTIACWFNAGIQSVAFKVYLVPIVWGAMAFGVYGLVALTGLSVLSGIGMVVAERIGWLPVPLTEPHIYSELATNITIFVLTAFAISKSIIYYQAALKRVRQSERLLRETERTAHVGSWEWDIGSQVETWSEGQYHIMGYKPGSVTPSHDLFLASIETEDVPVIKKALNEAINDVRPYNTEFHRTNTEGRRFTYLSRGDIIRDADGVPLRMLGMSLDITDLRQAEEERARLTAILENTSDFIGMAQPDGRITYINAAGRRLLGWPLNEDLSNHLVADLHPTWENDKLRNEAIPIAIRHGIWHGESVLKKRDGSEIPVAQIIMAHHTVDGKLAYLSTHIRDITQQREVEQALREGEEWFRNVANRAPIMIGVADENGDITFLNRTWLDFRGKKLEEELPWKWTAAVHPDDYDRMMMNRRVSIEQNEPYSVEYRIQDKNGEYRWLLENTVPIMTIDGKSNGFINTAVDITERKQIEKALRESEENFRKLFEANPFPLGITRMEDGSVLLINQAAMDLAEIKHFVSGSMKAGDFYADIKDRERMLKSLEQEGRRGGIVVNLKTTSGKIHPILMNAFPVQFNGEACLLIGMADLTDQVKAEEKVRRINIELEQRVRERTAQLEAANRELESFSYSVSHDLRTPLRSINGFANILSEDFKGDLPPAAHKYLMKIQKSAVHMGLLIDDLLMFSRLNKQQIKKNKLQLAEIFRQVFEEMAGEYEGRQVTLRISEMPECLADPILLKAVVANLLSNALKYTRPRAEAIIEAGAIMKNNRSVYYIKDNGVGFNMDYAGKLFGVFQRLHGKDEFDGTGVGLATVQRIIHRHGGEIWAEAVEGLGATFYFTLDVAKETE